MFVARFQVAAYLCAFLAGSAQGNVRKPRYQDDNGEIGRGCTLASTKSMPFCDFTLSIEDRVQDLIGRLTLKEKIGLLGATPGSGNSCALIDAGVARLGIRPYIYLVEVNDGVASQCLDGRVNKCSTNFVSAASLGASFNRTVWYNKGEVVASEMRAMHHTNSRRTPEFNTVIGLHGYGPNVNLMRDPRWGRNQEVPSEDPFLNGEYAKHYTMGMQQRDEKGYLKMHASIKHYTAYSVETGREGFNGIIDTFNMHDSYLPAFEKGIKEGKSNGAMCSYAAINGVPSCANSWLFDKARIDWNQTNFLITTDCGALWNMFSDNGNHYAKTWKEAITKTIKAGTDLEMGDDLYQREDTLYKAITEDKMASESNVNAALGRVLYHRFQLGMFDPLDRQVFAQGDHIATINSTEHQAINLEAAIQGLVLLQNPDHKLPLKSGIQLAVVGPHAMSRQGLFEKYRADYACFNNTFDCVPSIGENMARYNTDGETVIVATSLKNAVKEEIKQAVDAASKSDVTVVCVGLDLSIETEGLDRVDLQLPLAQRQLLQALYDTTHNLVVVLVNGGALAIEELVSWQDVAIVEVFYPAAVGGHALARTVFGLENRWGLMPFTVYSKGYVDELDMNDMSFTKSPGRTYRYYTGKNELLPFGHGLSYTDFLLKDCSISTNDEIVQVSCNAQNMGELKGDAILLLFHRVVAADNLPHPVPHKSLIDFSRHTLLPGAATTIVFEVTPKDMSLVNALGDRAFYDQFVHEFEIVSHNQVSWRGEYTPRLLGMESTSLTA